MLSLVVFLGNPGTEYTHNRHNAGRLLAKKLPFYDGLAWKKKFHGRYGSLFREQITGVPVSESNRCHFLIPETYMNLSGISVKSAAAFYSIPPGGIIAVHDELELPLGYLSLKFAGGLGGHNGLRSMKEALGTADFWRLRVGIGRPQGRLPGEGGRPVKGVHEGGDGLIAQWVLSDFTANEAECIEVVFNEGTSLLTRALSCDPETLLPEWKKKKVV